MREVCYFLQEEDGIRDLVQYRGLEDVYKTQEEILTVPDARETDMT